MDDRERQLRDIRDERYIDDGANNDMHRSGDVESRGIVENQDLNIVMPRDHP